MPYSYLLADIPPDLRKSLSQSAATQDTSIQNVVLGVLYEHYGLEVPARQRERRYSAELDRRSTRLQIRATPELFEEVKRDASRTSTTMRRIIIDILVDRFGPT